MELETLLERDATSRAIKEETKALRAVRDELSSNLDAEKAKLESLRETIEKEKETSFQAGCSSIIQAYLTSPVFEQKKRDVIKEFLGTKVFHHSVDARLKAFKSSQEFRDLVDRQVEQFKSSKPFEGLLTQRFEDYKAFVEFDELQMSLMRYAREQILDRFWRKCPEVDLSFLNESDSEDVEIT